MKRYWLHEFQSSAVRHKEDYKRSCWKTSASLKKRIKIAKTFLEKYAYNCSKVLDAGCGPGTYLALLSRFKTTVALDFSINMLKIAKYRNRNALLCCGDVENLPFSSPKKD